MRLKLAMMVTVAMLVAACGTGSPAETLVGEWELDGTGHSVLFEEDGTWGFEIEGSCGTWSVSEDEPPILIIYDDSGNLEGNSQVVFDGDDAFQFTMDGRSYRFTRVE